MIEPNSAERKWTIAAHVSDIPTDGGACAMVNNIQIAIFYFSNRNEWYACQNQCPHKKQMILSRGMTGSSAGEPKVACPFHKRAFSLVSGECLNADEEKISTFPVKVENGYVYVDLSAHVTEDISCDFIPSESSGA